MDRAIDAYLFLSTNHIKNKKFIKEKTMESTTELIIKIVSSLLLIIVIILALIYSCCKDDTKDTETVGITATTVP